MPEPYTESFTGTVARVWHGDRQHPHSIIMRDHRRYTIRFYCWGDWTAALCEEASKSERPLTLEYSRTAYGSLITALDFAAPPDEAAS